MEFQLKFTITNTSESEMMDTAIFIKDNYASLIHQVTGKDKTFAMSGTLLIADFNGLVSTIQAFKVEFGTRFTYTFTMDKDLP